MVATPEGSLWVRLHCQKRFQTNLRRGDLDDCNTTVYGETIVRIGCPVRQAPVHLRASDTPAASGTGFAHRYATSRPLDDGFQRSPAAPLRWPLAPRPPSTFRPESPPHWPAERCPGPRSRHQDRQSRPTDRNPRGEPRLTTAHRLAAPEH